MSGQVDEDASEVQEVRLAVVMTAIVPLVWVAGVADVPAHRATLASCLSPSRARRSDRLGANRGRRRLPTNG